MNRKQKLANLRDDEFRPLASAYPGGFWTMPRSIAAIPEARLKPGPKLLYSVLCTRAAQTGTTWASTDSISDDLGGISKSTLYRWQQPLVKEHLIRVHQKGRGLPNNYYILKSPWIDEFDADLIEYQRERRERDKRDAENELFWAEQREWEARPDVIKFTEEVAAWAANGKQGPAPLMPPASYHPRQEVDPEVLARWEQKCRDNEEQMRQWQEQWASDAATPSTPQNTDVTSNG